MNSSSDSNLYTFAGSSDSLTLIIARNPSVAAYDFFNMPLNILVPVLSIDWDYLIDLRSAPIIAPSHSCAVGICYRQHTPLHTEHHLVVPVARSIF